MDTEEFRKVGYRMIDYVANYFENLKERNVTPPLEPGFMRQRVPTTPNDDPEEWDEIFNDIEDVVMDGMTHWHHPNFHAYFPTGHSWSCVLADILSTSIGCIGFTWESAPSCTELEMSMVDWVGQMIGLPKEFLFLNKDNEKFKQHGGGIIQTSASECTLFTLLTAKRLKLNEGNINESDLVCYTSEQAHSSVQKAAMLANVLMRMVKTDENDSMRGSSLEQVIEEDVRNGLKPIYTCATLGTTASCSFDDLEEIGMVCKKYGIWLHVDAAFAGSALICPEYHSWMSRGFDLMTSFCFNPHKWMLINFDCSMLWVRDKDVLTKAFVVDPAYLKHDNQALAVDYRHWQIGLGRRFRSLKLWFTIRRLGVKQIQEWIRLTIDLGKQFEAMVKKDDRFELYNDAKLSLVCFRLKGSNEKNEILYKKVNNTRKIFISQSKIKDVYFLRFVTCSRLTKIEDIEFAWNVIQTCIE
uniref:Aromatic-L-amino-acid decarboxylase n=1 Tax=Hofstenia miamia TaxID=442651 RepID=A0A7G7LK75_HOFMI|nr:aromatic amino acid decarboxylase 1 [Hofstenia miamia]